MVRNDYSAWDRVESLPDIHTRLQMGISQRDGSSLNAALGACHWLERRGGKVDLDESYRIPGCSHRILMVPHSIHGTILSHGEHRDSVGLQLHALPRRWNLSRVEWNRFRDTLRNTRTGNPAGHPCFRRQSVQSVWSCWTNPQRSRLGS